MKTINSVVLAVILLGIVLSPAFADAPRAGQPAPEDINGSPTISRTGEGKGLQVQVGPHGPAYRPNQGEQEEVQPASATNTRPGYRRFRLPTKKAEFT